MSFVNTARDVDRMQRTAWWMAESFAIRSLLERCDLRYWSPRLIAVGFVRLDDSDHEFIDPKEFES